MSSFAPIKSTINSFPVSVTPYSLITIIDDLTILNCSPGTVGGPLTIYLPATAKYAEKIVWIKDYDGTCSIANPIILNGHGAETIDGSATYTITVPYSSITLYCNGISWEVWDFLGSSAGCFWEKSGSLLYPKTFATDTIALGVNSIAGISPVPQALFTNTVMIKRPASNLALTNPSIVFGADDNSAALGTSTAVIRGADHFFTGASGTNVIIRAGTGDIADISKAGYLRFQDHKGADKAVFDTMGSLYLFSGLGAASTYCATFAPSVIYFNRNTYLVDTPTTYAPRDLIFGRDGAPGGSVLETAYIRGGNRTGAADNGMDIVIRPGRGGAGGTNGTFKIQSADSINVLTIPSADNVTIGRDGVVATLTLGEVGVGAAVTHKISTAAGDNLGIVAGTGGWVHILPNSGTAGIDVSGVLTTTSTTYVGANGTWGIILGASYHYSYLPVSIKDGTSTLPLTGTNLRFGIDDPTNVLTGRTCSLTAGDLTKDDGATWSTPNIITIDAAKGPVNKDQGYGLLRAATGDAERLRWDDSGLAITGNWRRSVTRTTASPYTVAITDQVIVVSADGHVDLPTTAPGLIDGRTIEIHAGVANIPTIDGSGNNIVTPAGAVATHAMAGGECATVTWDAAGAVWRARV